MMQQLMSDVEEVIRQDMENVYPYVKIIEQPASKALRFRYECEGRSAGSIPGVNSTRDNKTHPTIQICNHKGPAIVVVSCVTKDPPHRPHPHNLVGKDGCSKGVCTVPVNKETMKCSFTNLGIQCVKRREIEDALKARASIRVDPFKTGFEHQNQTGSIDLNSIRLCFQVFLEGSTKGKYTYPLKPVVSDPIYDKKAMSDLVICKMSICSAPVCGGTEIILLCDKVAKDNTEVRFFEICNGVEVWQGFGDFHPADVHKQVAISFRTPRYKDQNIQKPIDVFVELRRKKDGATSTPRSFQFIPLDRDPEGLHRKRVKIDTGILSRYAMSRQIESSLENRNIIHPNRVMKKELEIEPSLNDFPTMLGNSNPSPAYQVITKMPLYSSPALYDTPMNLPMNDINIAENPLTLATEVDPCIYSPLQASTASQLPIAQVLSLAQSSANQSSLISQAQNSSTTQKATVHNVPPIVQEQQSLDEHMSEKLNSLDLGLRVEASEISLPLSDINLSLFESENISLSRIMDSDIVDESNNNIVNIAADNAKDETGNSQHQHADDIQTSMSTDSFNKLTSRVNNELETLNYLGLNMGIKSEMSSS